LSSGHYCTVIFFFVEKPELSEAFPDDKLASCKSAVYINGDAVVLFATNETEIGMSLRTKIGLSFFISAFIIAALSVFEFVNFLGVRKEISYLEVTDSIRSKALQIRRHEKNFFLYPTQAKEQAAAIQRYIDDLNAIIRENATLEKSGRLRKMEVLVNEYSLHINRIKQLIGDTMARFAQERAFHGQYADFFPLIESSFYEDPLRDAVLLKKLFSLPDNHWLLRNLRDLDAEIALLRKTGEDLISMSREIDKAASDGVERIIQMSQAAMIVFLLLFFLSGIVTLFLINRNVVGRLKLLIGIIERTGKGTFPIIDLPLGKWDNDEVGMLIREFNSMEKELARHEKELSAKNSELLQSKKLAAIGTLAAGVAHELNNPLNNIYLSVQVLKKIVGGDCPPSVKEIVGDITAQTARVKHIVGELLEFARGRDPEMAKIDLKELLLRAFKAVSSITNVDRIDFSAEIDRNDLAIEGDQLQLEQAFINLFHNAVEAMNGSGKLAVRVASQDKHINIQVSDTGKGIPAEALERLFEPFFTTKDKGTGLGLAITFNIIQKHGGELSAESVEGKGSTFHIRLPKESGQHGI